ncbi:FAD-linked oxidase C-terminal domain-containing protein, partial [Robbsia andropogonis]|uniref:FAD-linked oxidase C-terminal domain-containing protein n=1 Tax=Robbsia andropogonis TaxID=28092 RepID=UPI0026464FC4
LGVIVEATLKLRALPRGTAVTIRADFASVEQAARASSVVMAGGVTPAILEVLDAAAVRNISAHLGVDLGDGALLLA